MKYGGRRSEQQSLTLIPRPSLELIAMSCVLLATRETRHGIPHTVEADSTSANTTKRNIFEPRTRNASTPAQAMRKSFEPYKGAEIIHGGCTTVPFLRIGCAGNRSSSRSTIIVGTDDGHQRVGRKTIQSTEGCSTQNRGNDGNSN